MTTPPKSASFANAGTWGAQTWGVPATWASAGSRGALAGGKAESQVACSIVSSSGAVAGGSAVISGLRSVGIVSYGGAVASGEAVTSNLRSVRIVSYGGALAGGNAVYGASGTLLGSGGAVASSKDATQIACSVVGSGGALAGGESFYADSGMFAGSGGSVASGNAGIWAAVSIASSSGGLAGGSALDESHARPFYPVKVFHRPATNRIFVRAKTITNINRKAA